MILSRASRNDLSGCASYIRRVKIGCLKRVHVSPDRADVLAGGDLRQAAGPPEHPLDIGGGLGFHRAERIGDFEETVALLDTLAEFDLEVDEAAGGRAVLLESRRADLVAGIDTPIEKAVRCEHVKDAFDADRDALVIESD